MLKFVKVISFLFYAILIFFAQGIGKDPAPFSFMYTRALMLITVVYLLPLSSLVLLFNNKKFSPNFKFRFKYLAIIFHIIVFTIAVLLSAKLIHLEKEQINLIMLTIAFIVILPLINFISIFEYRFVKRLFASSDKGMPDA